MSENFSSFKMPKWLIALLAISALLLVILFALGVLGGSAKIESGNTALSSSVRLPVGAKLWKVSHQPLVNSLSWQGTVHSRLAVKIAPKWNARILELPVHSGDRLKKGAVIARLDDRELRAAFNAANAAQIAAQVQAAQARSEEKRITELYDKQAATRQNYEAILAQSQAAQAMANQAISNAQQSKVQLGEDVLYAPFDGIVGERLQDPGDMAMANQAVVTFLNPDDLRFEVAIAEQCSVPIQPGQEVTVHIDAIQKTLTGKIEEIAPEIDPQTRTRLLKITLPSSPGLQHGQFGWLALGCQAEQQVLLIPDTAILHYGQLQAVRVVSGETTAIRHIRTGKAYGKQLEVLSGLHDGETILLDGGLAP